MSYEPVDGIMEKTDFSYNLWIKVTTPKASIEPPKTIRHEKPKNLSHKRACDHCHRVRLVYDGFPEHSVKRGHNLSTHTHVIVVHG